MAAEKATQEAQINEEQLEGHWWEAEIELHDLQEGVVNLMNLVRPPPVPVVPVLVPPAPVMPAAAVAPDADVEDRPSFNQSVCPLSSSIYSQNLFPKLKFVNRTLQELDIWALLDLAEAIGDADWVLS